MLKGECECCVDYRLLGFENCIIVIFVVLLRIIAISLLLTIVFAQTPVHQLMKITVLVEHYFEHKALDEQIDFMDFLAMHYADDTKHGDYDRDMQLPFKQCNHAPLMAFTFFEAGDFDFGIKSKPVFVTEKQVLTGYQSPYHSSEALSNIWQPPRI